jgi:hypothetical protein
MKFIITPPGSGVNQFLRTWQKSVVLLYDIDTLPEMVWIRRKLREDYGALWWRNPAALRTRDHYLIAIRELIERAYNSQSVFICADPAITKNTDLIAVTLPEYNAHVHNLAEDDNDYARSVITSKADLDEIRAFYHRFAQKRNLRLTTTLIEAYALVKPNQLEKLSAVAGGKN